jgi:hypothetical protein
VSLFREVRSVATSFAHEASKRALDRAPSNVKHAVSNVKEAVEKIRTRYEAGRVDAQKALEELSELEERALKMTFQLLMFPWATTGAIREIFGRVRELEGSLKDRDETIRRLEERIRALESRDSNGA